MTWRPGVATCWFSTTALQSWLTKLANANSQMTVIEHNSGIIYLAMVADTLSGPAEVQLAQATNPVAPYRFVDIAGDAVAPGTTNATRVPLFGVLPEPPDSERKLWWDALHDVIERLDYHDASTGNASVNAKPSDAVWVGVAGDAAECIYRSWEYADTTTIQEPRDLAPQLPQLLLAAISFGNRLKLQAAGNTTAAATTTSAIETQQRPLAQALATAVQSADRKANIVAVVVAAATGVVAGIGGWFSKLARKAA